LVSQSHNPVRDDQGKVLRWYAACADIEDRKRAEERLQRENAALREELDHASMFEEIVGSSEPLQKVLSQVSKVARQTRQFSFSAKRYGQGVDRARHPQAFEAIGAVLYRGELRCDPNVADCFRALRSRKGGIYRCHTTPSGRFEVANGAPFSWTKSGICRQIFRSHCCGCCRKREIERVGSDKPIPWTFECWPQPIATSISL